MVEPDPFRQRACREILADDTNRVTVHTPHDSALAERGDLVIDTVGNLLEQSLSYAAPCGRMELVQRGLRLIGAGDYNSPLFPRAVQLAQWLPLERLVTHRFGIDEFDRALMALTGVPGTQYSALKVVIEPEPRVSA